MKTRGFTLVEVLVAVAILGIVSIMAYSGYNELSSQAQIANDRMQRVRSVQTAMLKLAQDFEQLDARPVREPMGAGTQPALRADTRTGSLVQLTHAGWANPAGIGRSTLQRVEYKLEGTVLYREQHRALDSVLNDAPVRVALLEKVHTIRFEFLDLQQQWSNEWPRLGTAVGPRGRPLAVRITVELEDWGTITRTIEVSNVTAN